MFQHIHPVLLLLIVRCKLNSSIGTAVSTSVQIQWVRHRGVYFSLLALKKRLWAVSARAPNYVLVRYRDA